MKPKSPKLQRDEEESGEDETNSKKPTPGELRVAQYEKPLEKGHRTTLKVKREKASVNKPIKRVHEIYTLETINTDAATNNTGNKSHRPKSL